MTSDEVLNKFAKWIENECGIIYEESNLYQLSDRVEQLVKVFNVSNAEALWKLLQQGVATDLKQCLTDISTNNETSFFRDENFYKGLKNNIFPQFIKNVGGLSNLNIWSVACSAGQEPYSMAMILNEIGLATNQKPNKIFATDISRKILAKAKLGIYSELEVGRGLPITLKNKYFVARLLLEPKLR